MEKSITKGWLGVVALFAALTLALCAFAPSQAYAAVDPGDNGFQKSKAGKVYFEDKKGNLVKGWFQVKGDKTKKWYYANPSTGILKQGWLKYKNQWYFLDPQDSDYPYMVANKIVNIQKNRVYWTDKISELYYFDKKGVMKTGWIKIAKGMWLYADDKGVLARGWKKINGQWYYFGTKDTGLTASNTEGLYRPYSTSSINPEQIGKYEFFFNGATAMVTGWAKVTKAQNGFEKGWYFFNKNGVKQTKKWIKDGGKWYYVNAKGKAVTGFNTIAGKTYYFNTKTCAMATGWVKVDKDWYYFNDAGAMVTNKWIKSNGKWYFVQKNGVMAKNAWVDVWHVNGSGAWDKTRQNKVVEDAPVTPDYPGYMMAA